MNHKEKYKFTCNYIKEYKNIVPQDLAHRIITQQDLAFHQATTNNGKLNKHRNCLIKKLDDQFVEEVSQVYVDVFKKYIREFTFFNSVKGESTGYDHVLYMGSQEQEYKEHVDLSHDKEPRILTCSLVLNDNYDGGNFNFFEGEYTIRKKACSAIVFPSNFCFPHAVTPVSNGDRHVIITWIR